MVLRAKSRDSGSTSARSMATCRWAAARSRLSRETVERGIWVNLAISRTPNPESNRSPMALSSTSFPAIVNAWWYRRARRHMLTASSQSSGNDPAPSASTDPVSHAGRVCSSHRKDSGKVLRVDAPATASSVGRREPPDHVGHEIFTFSVRQRSGHRRPRTG